MRIGVNALYLIPGGVGGTEVYLRQLLAAWERVDSSNEYFLFTNRETGQSLGPNAANFQVHAQPVAATNRPSRLLYEQFKLPAQLKRLKLDCLLNPGFTAPHRPGCPQATVFHDLQHIRHPEHFRRADLLAWRFFLSRSIRDSQRIIAVSEATREDVMRYYGVPDERVVAIPHGVAEEYRQLAGERNAVERMILCVSTLHPHKNLIRLISAFARFRDHIEGYRLVIAGMRGFHAEQIEAAIADPGLQQDVTLTGWIETEALLDLYRKAAFFVYPSTFEGFGMPVLEALAAGVPVISSRIPPLVSIAGEAALYFNPADEEGLLAAMIQLASEAELRSRLVHDGLKRAADQTWESTALKTLQVLQQLKSA